MHAELVVVRDDHALGGGAPRRHLLGRDAELARAVLMALAGGGGAEQVLLRHQVRVDVVVDDRAVLVGAGDAVDAEVAVEVVVAERAPQPRRLDEDVDADRRARSVGSPVACTYWSTDVGDVGVDVERRGPGRPVARALLAVNRAPGEGRAGQAEVVRARLRRRQRRVRASAARRRRRRARCT